MTVVFSASELLAIRMFPIDRQQYSLRVVDEALVRSDDEFLRQQVARALQLGEQALSLELDFRGTRPAKEYGDEARQLDFELDRALGALFGFLTSTVKSFGVSSPEGAQAQRVIERLFPKGVRYVIQLPFDAEEATVRLMLKRARSEPPMIEALRAVQAGRLVERVAELHARYARALPKSSEPPPPAFEEVLRARREGHERMCAIVLQLSATLQRGDLEEQQAAALATALAEVLRQNAAIGRYYKRRRRVAEVDPETGEELETEAESEEEFEEEDADDVSSPFTAEDVAEASDRVIEAIEELGERVADPWSPGKEDDMDEDVA